MARRLKYDRGWKDSPQRQTGRQMMTGIHNAGYLLIGMTVTRKRIALLSVLTFLVMC